MTKLVAAPRVRVLAGQALTEAKLGGADVARVQTTQLAPAARVAPQPNWDFQHGAARGLSGEAERYAVCHSDQAILSLHILSGWLHDRRLYDTFADEQSILLLVWEVADVGSIGNANNHLP